MLWLQKGTLQTLLLSEMLETDERETSQSENTMKREKLLYCTSASDLELLPVLFDIPVKLHNRKPRLGFLVHNSFL